MNKRLMIIGCCALFGFALGRWLSTPDAKRPVEQRTVISQVATPNRTIELPSPERAGRVPFLDLYRTLRTSSSKECIAYLNSIQELSDGPDRRAALTAFFQSMACISPQKAAELVRQVGKDDTKRAVRAVLGATAASETPELVKMLLDLPANVDPNWREEMVHGQMFFWAALDPTAAAQFADEYQSIYPDLAAAGIVQCLAAADPALAERWLKEHPDLSKTPEIIGNYVKGLYQSDPTNARRYLTEHATEEAVHRAMGGVARLTFLSSADAAVEFVSHLPTKDARRAALEGILDTNTELIANRETSQTAICAGEAEWVTKFPQEEWPTTMPQFLAQWRELDPDGSVSWMAKLPTTTRSVIVREFLRGLPSHHLKQVLAATTSDFHHDVLTAFAETLSQSPEERIAVLETLELSPEDAAQLAVIAR